MENYWDTKLFYHCSFLEVCIIFHAAEEFAKSLAIFRINIKVYSLWNRNILLIKLVINLIVKDFI